MEVLNSLEKMEDLLEKSWTVFGVTMVNKDEFISALNDIRIKLPEEIKQAKWVKEAMLRQALENGPGQQKEEQQKPQKESKEEEPDNEFMLEGIPMNAEGKRKPDAESTEFSGASQFLQTNTGQDSEYYNLANGGRKYCEKVRTICLTCETDCDQKKQWKIIE